MTNYFENAKTTEELKATYKELVKKYHPDVYGEKGNEILKDIHNQLEKAIKKVDKNFYTPEEKEETATVKAKKEEIAKELFKKYKDSAYRFLFVAYVLNGFYPANHRNPLTKHNFSGWNVWQLELQMLLKGYTSCEWSTFAQYKAAKNSIKKGEHGAYITLAIITKSKKNAAAEEAEEEEKTNVYYKGYTVFNTQQLNENLKLIAA